MSKKNILWQKWHILFKVLPLLIIIFILKLVFHQFGLEYISLNALFTSLIASTTFLIGFLITGVISDYKESEKLPGELASSLESLYDEAQILEKTKSTKPTKEFIRFYKDYVRAVNNWFEKKERTRAIMGRLSEMNDYFAKFEPLTQATFIAKMKNEQNTQRKIITRIHTIRETSFVQSAYAILEVLGFFVISGLLILKVEPFYEAVFFTVVVSFLIMYMVFLIKDLDNPFEYERYGETGTEVSLKPLHDFISRL
ncbi:MAG: hypothetical protein NDI94_06745 [Candidatus Woesearchaeota archaeon]|nr:hypothetical protein [Candidatus Woesearchaeota archaeon]